MLPIRKCKHRSQLAIELASAGSVKTALLAGMIDLQNVKVPILIVSAARITYSFNACGALLWELLDEKMSVCELQEKLHQLIGDGFYVDVSEFINRLEQNGLVCKIPVVEDPCCIN